MSKYVMALDAGTTSNRCIYLMKKRGNLQRHTERIHTTFSETGLG